MDASATPGPGALQEECIGRLAERGQTVPHLLIVGPRDYVSLTS